MTPSRRFEGKGVVVTGAGRGIGRATAECFAEAGAGVVLMGWHRDVLKEVASGIRRTASQSIVFEGDVSKCEANHGTVKACVEAFRAPRCDDRHLVRDQRAPVGLPVHGNISAPLVPDGVR